MLNPTLTTASANASRHEVVNWFNSLSLSVKDKPIKLVTVDELVDGVPVCLFFSKLFPNLLNEGRIKLNAKYEHDRFANWKLVQNVLDKLDLDKKINIDRILSGTRSELLEMAQWMVLFYEQNKVGQKRGMKASKEAPATPKTKEQEQEEIISTLIEERDLYFTKLKDIEHELQLINQTGSFDRLFGLSTTKFCERLNEILLS